MKSGSYVRGRRVAALSLVCAAIAFFAGAPRATAKTTPAIHWSDPAPVTYGTPLNTNLLNAWVSGKLAGTFVYSPAPGTVLGAGVHTLSVTFNPTDTADYNPVSATVGLEVTKAKLMVAAYNIKSLAYGSAIPTLGYSIKNFVNGDTAGSLGGAPSVTTTAVKGSPVGQYPIAVAKGTLHSNNYSFAFTGGTLTVTPALLLVTAYNIGPLPFKDAIPPLHYSITGFRNGEMQSVVSGAASVTTTAYAGSPPGQYPITPSLGTLSAPNYAFQFKAGTLTIVKQTPKITWIAPAAVVYGTALSATQLDARTGPPGTFVYSPATGTVPDGGIDTLSVTFTATDTSDYNTSTGTVELTVNPATPTINWPTPAAITVGTALSSVQLDATSPEAGTFVYTPPAGTLLSDGGHTLSVTFTPVNIADYAPATATAHLFIHPVEGATTTSLKVTSAGHAVTTVDSGSVITLTATVDVGGTLLNQGAVNFCDAGAAHCEDIHILGTAQLMSSGTASVRLRPALGSHSYKAVFTGTRFNTTSASGTAELAVTGLDASATGIGVSGNPGGYTLTSTVGGAFAAAPTGSVSFLDVSNGNALLGKVTLGAAAASTSFFDSSGSPTGADPYQIAVADFNGDGNLDIATINIGDSTFTILLGNGDGTSTATPVNSSTLGQPLGLTTGDFNGDGIPDLAVTHYESANGRGMVTTIFQGNGDGTFTAVVGGPEFGSSIYNPIAGDFNNDGILDLAFVSGAGVEISLGNGNGTFQYSGFVPTGKEPSGIAAADFNGDGYLDLAVTNLGDGTVTILLGNGDGTFSGNTFILGFDISPFKISVGDFNGDGIPDIAVIGDTSSYQGEVAILLGNGDGSFPPSALLYETGGQNPETPVVGDFNGDGILDLAVEDYNTGAFTLMLGDNTGNFSTSTDNRRTFGTGEYIAAGDFNGDGISDLAVPEHGITVFLAEPKHATVRAAGLSLAGTGTQQVVASYSGDSNYKPSVSQPVALTAGSSASPANSAEVNRPITPMSAPK